MPEIPGIERFEYDGVLYGLVVRGDYACPKGIQFLTPDDFSQQLAVMRHPSDKRIDAHWHRPLERSAALTQETLIVRRGSVRVDFYTPQEEYLESTVIETGDIILLAGGAHGFKFLEESDMVEIKQGPYAGPSEKSRFDSVPDANVRIRARSG